MKSTIYDTFCINLPAALFGQLLSTMNQVEEKSATGPKSSTHFGSNQSCN